MTDVRADFSNRLNRIGRRHRKLAHGYVTRVGKNGIITAYPRVKGPRIPVSGILIMIAVFFVFKAFMLAQMGPEGYADRLVRLQQGTVVEQAGAYAMQADQLTQMLAQKIGPIMR